MAILLSLLTILTFQTAPYSAQSVTKLQPSDSLIARNWTVEDGLPVNAVNEMIQDDQGYIWFTTYDGIVRFDGVDFKVFNHSNTPEMPQNRAVFLYEQEGTGIWVSLENGGVVLINKSDFTYFGEEEGFTQSDVTHMVEDSENTMWFGTYQGLFKYQNDEFTRAFKRDTPSQNRINSIYVASDGSKWISTHDGLVHLKNGQTKVYDLDSRTVHNEFTLVEETQNGDLWMGTRTGPYILNNESLVQPEQIKPLAEEYVTAIYEDEQVQLISTDRGLYLYDDTQLAELASYTSQYQSFQHFYRDSNGILWMLKNDGTVHWLKNDEIIPFDNIETLDYHFNRITEDREGNIWLSTARHGIVRVKRSQVRTIGEPEGLSGGNILGLFEDSRGRFWVGTRDKGLNIIEGNQVTHLEESGPIASDIVHSIAEDKQGNIWVGYYQRGVQKFTDNGIESYDLGFEPRINDVRTIHVANDSTIWLGTYGGLVKFDPENENHAVYTTEDGLAGNLVRYIDEDREGGLWIATADGGVSHFNNGTFKNYTEQQGLSSNNIRSVYVDEFDSGTVWVGTENRGLNRIHNNSVAFLGLEDGLPDHIIHYIGQDQDGWLWMSSNRGVFKVKKDDLNDYLDGNAGYFQMVHYGRPEGMRNPECNGSFQQAGLKTSNGEFWFATQEGVAVFEINPRLQNNVPPRVVIENVLADGERYAKKSVNFEPGVNNFEIDFNALTFSTPEKTQFRYKLDGYDENWTEVNNKRTVAYLNVPPGEYTFQVMAANNNGIWSPEGARASINIKPLFYQQTWFYLLALALLGSAFYGASRLRYRYLMRRQERMQQIIDEQTAELRKEKNEIEQKNKIIAKQATELEQSNKAKDKFLSIIGHDLRNPFQALVGYTSLLTADHEQMDSDAIEEGLNEIENSADRLLNLVENLLSWASLQTGKVSPRPEWFLVNDLVLKNVKLLTPSARQKEININVELNESEQIYADRNMIDTIIRNLMSNAIKFTERGGTVTVETCRENEVCRIQIADTGIGMPPEMVDKVMQLDSKVSRYGTENEAGTGLGLIICNDMANLHDGSIAVDSTEGEGTTFTVSLPQNEWKDDENPEF